MKIKLTTRAIGALVNTDGTTVFPTTAPSCDLYVDYIYLDTDERRRFAQVSHEYLIEQVQRETGTMSELQKLNFNHPVKELIWTIQATAAGTEGGEDTGNDATLNVPTLDASLFKNNDYFNYSPGNGGSEEIINGASSKEGFTNMKLQLNGYNRFSARKASYFRICQPIQAGHKVPSKHIYCYSFALKPEEHQPSGTCNFSRIDNAQMIFDACAEGDLTVYAVNYNVLRIMSGMGGLAYSN